MNRLLLNEKIGCSVNVPLFVRSRQFERLVESGNKTFYNVKQKANCLDLSQDGCLMINGNNDGSVALWSLESKLKGDGKLVNTRLAVSKRTLPSNEQIEVAGHDARRDVDLVHSFQTKFNKYRLYRGSSRTTENQQLQQQQDESVHTHKYSISTVKWYGNDNGMFFTGSNDKFIKIWDTETCTPVESIELVYQVNQLDTVRSELSYVTIASDDYYPRIIDLRNMNLGITICGKNEKHMSSEILTCKVNPTKPHLLASGDNSGSVKIWDTRMNNKLLLELKQNSSFNDKAHLRPCVDVEWDSEGTHLTTIGMDGKILLWDPFDNNRSINMFNENEFNDSFAKFTSSHFRIIGNVDTNRIRFKKRTSRRLVWFDNYLLVNTDLGELQIFDVASTKFYNKIEIPYQFNTNLHDGQFYGMALQSDMSNSMGLKLITSVNSNRNNNNQIVEYS